MNMYSKFRSTFTREQRLNEFKRIISKHPDRIPIVIDIESKGLHLKKRKYLAPSDMLFCQFQHIIRQQLKVSPNESLFFFYDWSIPSPTHTLAQVYKERPSEDGFMVLKVSKENTFG